MTDTTTIDLDSVCTHADLIGEIGSEVQLRRMLPAQPSDTTDPTRPFRQRALEDVVKLMKRREPPIHEGNLSDLTQLRDAVIYGTLSRLYRVNATTDADVHSAMWRHWERRMESEVMSMRVDVAEGGVVNMTGISVRRR